MFSFNSESAHFDVFVTLAHVSKVLNARGFATLDSMFIVLYLCMDMPFFIVAAFLHGLVFVCMRRCTLCQFHVL